MPQEEEKEEVEEEEDEKYASEKNNKVAIVSKCNVCSTVYAPPVNNRYNVTLVSSLVLAV